MRAWTPARGAIPSVVAIPVSPAEARVWIQDVGLAAAVFGVQAQAAIPASAAIPVSSAEARASIQGERAAAAVSGVQVQTVIPAWVVALVAILAKAGTLARAVTPATADRVADGFQAAGWAAAQRQARDDRPRGEAPARDGNPPLAERERNVHRSPDDSRLRFVDGHGFGWQTGRDSAWPPARWNAGQARARRGARCGPQPAPARGDHSIRRGRR